MNGNRHGSSLPSEGLPTLECLLAFFEEEEVCHGHHELEAVISSKRLTRKTFFEEASWAILESGFKWQVAQSSRLKAHDCGFPKNWKVLGEWGDNRFEAWCKSMAAKLSSPRDDLTGKFREKWWAIWDLAWHLLQFDTEDSFRDHFFDGKTEGHTLTDEDIRRLKKIKDEEGRLFMIGEANRYFVLRNLGGDFLKPDVWIQAFSQWYGDVTVSELAQMLKEQEIRCGRFDAYCWSYCMREIQVTDRLASHFDGLFCEGDSTGFDLHHDGYGDVASFEDSVWQVEGIRIVVRDRVSSRVNSYPYQRGANQNWTLSQLITKRIRSLLHDRQVIFIGGDGYEPNARTKLRTIRASYDG